MYVCVLTFPATRNDHNILYVTTIITLLAALFTAQGVHEGNDHQPRLQQSHDTLHTTILIRFNKQACIGIHNAQVEI